MYFLVNYIKTSALLHHKVCWIPLCRLIAYQFYNNDINIVYNPLFLLEIFIFFLSTNAVCRINNISSVDHNSVNYFVHLSYPLPWQQMVSFYFWHQCLSIFKYPNLNPWLKKKYCLKHYLRYLCLIAFLANFSSKFDVLITKLLTFLSKSIKKKI